MHEHVRQGCVQKLTKMKEIVEMRSIPKSKFTKKEHLYFGTVKDQQTFDEIN